MNAQRSSPPVAFHGAGGGAMFVACALATLLRCSDAEVVMSALAPASFSFGTLAEQHSAERGRGCSPEAYTESYEGSTVLTSERHHIVRRFDAGIASTSFEFDALQQSAPGGGVLLVTATARIELSACCRECSGGQAQFTWTGEVELPRGPARYDLRITSTGMRVSSLSVERFRGECQIETPWRAPVVVDEGTIFRVVSAMPGRARLAVRCDGLALMNFVSIGCCGAPRVESPARMNIATWKAARLDVRFEFTAH